MKQEHLKRIRRLMTIIIEVKTSPRQTISQLLERLGISKSQFYKDRKVLADLGFVFGYDRTLKKLVLHQDSTLPVENLTLSERLALIMASRQFSASADYTLTYEGFNAARKLAVDLPRPFMESIFDDIVLKEGFGCTHEVMRDIQKAIEENWQLMLLYQKPENDEPTQEKMDPYQLFFRRRSLYMDGYSRTEGDIRTYRLSRIRKVTFECRGFAVREDYDFGRRYKNAFSAFGGEGTEHVVVRFNREARPYIEDCMWHHTQKTTRQPGGYLLFEVDIYYPREVMWWAFRKGAGAEILEPEWLREEAKETVKEMCRLYDI